MQRLVKEHVIAPASERASYGNVAEQELRPWITGRYAGLYYWTSAIGKLVGDARAGPEDRARAVPHAARRARRRACSTAPA